MDIISICRKYDYKNNRAKGILWTMANNIDGAVKKQTSDLSQASILQHFSVSGAGFNTKVQIIDDNVDVNFVIADE